jgi:hypothetical protein
MGLTLNCLRNVMWIDRWFFVGWLDMKFSTNHVLLEMMVVFGGMPACHLILDYSFPWAIVWSFYSEESRVPEKSFHSMFPYFVLFILMGRERSFTKCLVRHIFSNPIWVDFWFWCKTIFYILSFVCVSTQTPLFQILGLGWCSWPMFFFFAGVVFFLWELYNVFIFNDFHHTMLEGKCVGWFYCQVWEFTPGG